VDWLIVGPIELFAFYGQHYGRQSVLDAYRQLSRIEGARASACEFLLVDGDCASALIRLTNVDNRTGHEISFRVAHFARFHNGKVVEYCGIPVALGRQNRLSGARSM